MNATEKYDPPYKNGYYWTASEIYFLWAEDGDTAKACRRISASIDCLAGLNPENVDLKKIDDAGDCRTEGQGHFLHLKGLEIHLIKEATSKNKEPVVPNAHAEPAPPAATALGSLTGKRERSYPLCLVGYFTDSALALRDWLAAEPRDREQVMIYYQFCLDYWKDRLNMTRIHDEFEDHAYKNAPSQIRQLEQLRENIDKYVYNDMKPIPEADKKASAPEVEKAGETIGKLRWLGKKKASWEKIYKALTDQGFIDKSPSTWAAHFVDKNGSSMPAPEGGNWTNGKSDTNTEAALGVITRAAVDDRR